MEQHLVVGQDVTAEHESVAEIPYLEGRVDRGIVVPDLEGRVGRGIVVPDLEGHVDRGIAVPDLEGRVDRGIVGPDCSAHVEDQAEHWRKHCKMLSKQVK